MKIRPSGLLTRNNQLLVMRYQYGGQARFNLPGGNAEVGETLQEVLVREFQEELQIQVTPGDLYFLAETRVADRQVFHAIFAIDVIDGEVRLDPEQTSALEICWLDAEQLRQVQLYPAVGLYLAQWLEGGQIVPPQRYLGRVEQPWFG